VWHVPPLRHFSCTEWLVILVSRGARKGACRWEGRFGAHGSGAWRPPVASRPDVSRDVFSGAWLRHARSGELRSAAAFLGQFLRLTGLPSRSVPAAPPLRLAALRWRVAVVVLGGSQPPPGVSTAFLVAVARLSDTRLPRIATLENVPTRTRGVSSTFSRSGTSHRCVTSRALSGS
jgi:hypothetical protein